MTDHVSIPVEAWPRCCRAAYDMGMSAGPDPSGRYEQCPNCRAAEQPSLLDTLGPPRTPMGLTTADRPTVTR